MRDPSGWDAPLERWWVVLVRRLVVVGAAVVIAVVALGALALARLDAPGAAGAASRAEQASVGGVPRAHVEADVIGEHGGVGVVGDGAGPGAVDGAAGGTASDAVGAGGVGEAAGEAAGSSGIWIAGTGGAALADRIDPDWIARVAAATGIPPRALAAYAAAALRNDEENPRCGLGWNTLAAIGAIESGHGTHGGASVAPDGWTSPRILGAPLNGNGVAAIRDTDGGVWDGDTVWDRAVGPMQFIPDTWSRWGADGNGDGIADPNHIDDAALAAARYLCAGGPVTDAAAWRAAIFSYNHLDSYVNDVAAVANRYAEQARR